MISSLAVLTQGIETASREFRILPPGVFRSNDGRPEALPGWKIDASIAAQVIAGCAGKDDMVIDYEHQTLLTKQNGQPAPAAGWFNQVIWRDGLGLFAINVSWTDKAKAMIASREYRFISPVFSFNAVTGAVERLFGMGLTNNPGLSGLTDLSKVVANTRQSGSAPRDSDHSIDAFNQVFGPCGVFHPDTSPERIAELTGNTPKPKLAAEIAPHQREMMRRLYPDAFAPD